MTRPLLTVLVVAALVLSGVATAQQPDRPTRVAILPFTSVAGAPDYAPVGLAVALSRALAVAGGFSVVEINLLVDVSAALAQAQADTPADLMRAVGADLLVAAEVGGPTTLRVSGRVLRRDGTSAGITAQANEAALGELTASLARQVLEHSRRPIPEASLQRVLALARTTPGPAGLRALVLALMSESPSAALEVLRPLATVEGAASWVISAYAANLALGGEADQALGLFNEAVRRNPAELQAWTGIGVLSIRLGRNQTAEVAFREVLRLNPADPNAQYSLGVIALRAAAGASPDQELELLTHAEVAFRRAITSDPTFSLAYAELAALYASRGLGDEALGVLITGARNAPFNLGLLGDAVGGLVAAGRADDAVSFLQELSDRPEAARAPALVAPMVGGRERAAELVRVTEAALRIYPDDPGVLYSHAVLLLRAGRVGDAETSIRRALARLPDQAELLTGLGQVLAERGDAAGALAAFRRAAGAAGDDRRAQENLVRALLIAGRTEEALLLARSLAQRADADAEGHHLYGIALLRTGAMDAAAVQMGLAVNKAPQSAEYRAALAAVEDARRLTVDEPRLPEGARRAFDRGRTALDLGQAEEALEHFREVAGLAPRSATAAFYVAFSLHRLGRLEEAVLQYQRALELAPRNPVFLNNLALAEAARGRLDRAIERLREAVAVDPGYARAHLNLGILFLEIGLTSPAVDSLREAARLDPSLRAQADELIRRAGGAPGN